MADVTREKETLNFLCNHFDIGHGDLLSVEYVTHNFHQFRVFNPISAEKISVVMQEFHGNGEFFLAGYCKTNKRLYIRDNS